MKIFRHKTLILLMLMVGTTSFGQHKKMDKNYKTSGDVKIIMDARHTNVTFEVWDKNEVQIESFLDPGLSTAEAKNQLESWNLVTTGNSTEVKINSGGGGAAVKSPDMDIASFTESMGHLQSLIAPIMSEMVAPMLDNIAKHPPLPPDFAAKMGNLNFDYEAYQKDGDKYLKKWEAKVEKNFGKDFEASMEQWAEQFEKNAEVWGKNLEKEMEVNGEEFEKSMEKWAENFGAQMEKWGESFAREVENIEKSEIGKEPRTTTKSNRNIKIKMPAGAKLQLDVRHGAVELGGKTTNLNANLSHSSLKANIIDGKDTHVKVSYSPVNISQWNYGILNAGYAHNVNINKAKSIKLVSNSSNVSINEIGEMGILSGTFGALKVGRLSPEFKNLDITLNNSDLELSLPQTGLNFNYNGTQSKIDYPKASSIKSTSSYDNEMLNGFYRSANANRNISINATFSKIIIK